MASLAKQLMDVYYKRAQEYKAAGEYGKGSVFDACENMVNNFLHGRSFPETAELSRSAFEMLAEKNSLEQERRDAYAEGVQLLDEFVASHQF